MSGVHIHLLLNHIPVIGGMFVLALLALALVRRSSELAKIALGFFAVLGAVAVVVFLTGEPAEELVEGLPGVSEGIMERHEELALIATVAMAALGSLSLAALAAFRRRLLPRWVGAAGFALALGVGGLMGYTANLGGQIRHTEIRAGTTVDGGTALDDDDGERRRERDEH
jgi:hypothetical protein